MHIAPNPNPPAAPEPWVTMAALCAYFSISDATVERRMKDGLPHAKIGRQLRFRVSEVETWLMSNSDGQAAA